MSYMESTGSFEYCRRVLTTLVERARKLIGELDEEGLVAEGAAGKGKKGKGVLRILDMMAV